MHIPSPFCKNKLMSAGESNPHSLTFMWETRPVRFPKKQKRSVWVAGICEGIAVRYNIDPVLVRIAFIIATISGYGLSLYLLLWLCLPRYSVDRAPFEVLSNNHYGKYNHDQSTGWVLVIVLALLIGPGLNSFSPIFVITHPLPSQRTHSRQTHHNFPRSRGLKLLPPRRRVLPQMGSIAYRRPQPTFRLRLGVRHPTTRTIQEMAEHHYTNHTTDLRRDRSFYRFRRSELYLQ